MRKLLKLIVIPMLIIMIFCFGMNVFASLHSKWSAGDLVFYDGATDIFVIRDSTDGVKIFDDLNLMFGTDNDATIVYDEASTNKLILTCSNGFTLTGALGITGNVLMATTSRIQFNDVGVYIYSSIDGDLDLVSYDGSYGYVNLTGKITIPNEYLVLYTNVKLEFGGYVGGNGEYIYSSADTLLDIVADATLTLTAPAIDLVGALGVTGDILMSTTSKIQFRDTSMYIYSNAADDLKIVSVADLWLSTSGDMYLEAPTIWAWDDFHVGSDSYIDCGVLDIIFPTTAENFIDVHVYSSTPLANDVIGMKLNLFTSVAMTTDKDVTGYQVTLPAFTQSAANTTLITGFNLPIAGTLVQNTAPGTIIWKGLNVQLPNTTQTTGAVYAYGIYITSGTITSGTQIGLHIGGAMSTGIKIGAVTTGIDFTGTLATGINFCNATFLPTADRSDIAIAVGSRANALTITLANENTQHFEPIQVNVDVAGVNPLSTSDVSLMRMQSTHTTATMDNLRLRHINSYMVIEQDIQAAYIYTGSLDLSTNAVTVTTEAAVMNLNLECASVVSGKVRGLIINMYGANLAGADSVGLEVRTDGGASVLDEGIRIWSVGGNSITTALDVRGTVTYFADFDNASGAAGTVCTESGTAATNWAGRVKVQTPDGNDAWVNVYSTSNE